MKYIIAANTELMDCVLSLIFITGASTTKQISISSSKSSLVVGESVALTCSATLSDSSNTSSIQYVWSGPAMNDSGSSHILPLHNIHLSEAGEYKCSVSLHNSSIAAGIPVVLQCK